MSEANVAVVKSIYDCFDVGDINGLLGLFFGRYYMGPSRDWRSRQSEK